MASIDVVIDCLNEQRVRCTYKAVGEVIGCGARSVQDHLQDWNSRRNLPGPHRDPHTSWVVNAHTGEPSGYTGHQTHLDLYRTSHIVTTGDELRELLRRCWNPHDEPTVAGTECAEDLQPSRRVDGPRHRWIQRRRLVDDGVVEDYRCERCGAVSTEESPNTPQARCPGYEPCPNCRGRVVWWTIRNLRCEACGSLLLRAAEATEDDDPQPWLLGLLNSLKDATPIDSLYGQPIDHDEETQHHRIQAFRNAIQMALSGMRIAAQQEGDAALEDKLKYICDWLDRQG